MGVVVLYSRKVRPAELFVRGVAASLNRSGIAAAGAIDQSVLMANNSSPFYAVQSIHDLTGARRELGVWPELATL
jgi:hypothetical protein